MIILVHQNNIVIRVTRQDEFLPNMEGKLVGEVFFQIAKKFPNEILVWCQLELLEFVNLDAIPTLLQRKRMFISYNPYGNFFSDSIGYVEESPFINLHKKVTYPTWQMSSLVGATNTSLLLKIEEKLLDKNHFDFMLSSLAKAYMPKGMFCYSEPKLLLDIPNDIVIPKSNWYDLFTFVRKHYKLSWLFLLAFNLFWYERKWKILPFLRTLFFVSKMNVNLNISFENMEDTIHFKEESIDVVIPTMGRKSYLYNVLCDLKQQTHLPNKVIIVEQNPIENSQSELSYLQEEKWPFTIQHTFIQQLGACNARNIAIHQVESKWIFFADDDIRIKSTFLQDALQKIQNNNLQAVVFQCVEKEQNDNSVDSSIIQTTIFGSGSSIVTSEVKILFNKKLEFGYGEDTEFGLQLRNLGIDVVYVTTPNILHLKAPVGGFRYQHIFPWDNEVVKPLPMPTILLYKKLYYTKEQINGFRTSFFLHLASKQKGLGKIFFIRKFKRQWEASNYWSNILKNEN